MSEVVFLSPDTAARVATKAKNTLSSFEALSEDESPSKWDPSSLSSEVAAEKKR